MPEGVVLQKIRDFVVQIRHSKTDQIVGTGFVAKEGIITCAHVVRDAGVDPRSKNGKDLGIYFPEREGRPSASGRAKIAAYFPEHDDDVVLLQLVDGASPLEPGLVAKIGSATGSEDHEFSSFGYRKLQNYQGLPALGRIIEHCDRPAGKKLNSEPLMLKSQDIDKGMSGAPVLDKIRNLIIGVIYLSWDSAGGAHDRDTGFAVDAKVLSFQPLGLAMQREDLPKDQAPRPKIDIAKALAAVAPKQKVAWNNAPPSLEEWTGRKQLLQEITSDWVDSHIHITGLIGFGGEGKSSLAKRWVEDLIANKSAPQPDSIFWWGFYEKPNLDEFFEAALNHLSGGSIDASKIPSANTKAQILGAMLAAGRYLFVLDGMEVMQYQDGDQYGSLLNSDLKAFLEFFARPDHNSFCLVTSRAPLQDIMSYTTYKHHDVERLSPEDGRVLLQNLGIQGEDSELDKVVKDWDGHALTLSLLASYLKDHHSGDIRQISNIPSPTSDEPRYERVQRILRRYDEHLTPSQRAFMKLFSAFRTSIDKTAFDQVLRSKPKEQLLCRLIVYN